MRERGVTPHGALHRHGRRSAIDRRRARHPGHAVSRVIGKRIEAMGGLRRMRLRGLARPGRAFAPRVTADTLVRWPKLPGATA
jgi:hypothetical protein